MFIATLFTIARTWKQPKCPSTDEWIKKMWLIYTMEYYSAIKRNKIELFVVRWMDLESVIQSAVSQKEKNRITIWPSNPTTGHIPWENHNSKRVMYHNVHCNSICNSRDLEATYVSINIWTDKEDVAHIYNGILLSHKKKRNWVICSEVDGPRVCHTEWSKSERGKQIPHPNTYIWNLRGKKKGHEEPSGKRGIKTQTY